MNGPVPANDRRYSLMTWGFLALAIAPGIAVYSRSTLLDGYPLVVSALVGIAVAAGFVRLFDSSPTLRARFSWLEPWQRATGAAWVFLLAGPFWGIALGLLANRYLDRSTPVDHPTTALSVKRSRKGADSVYLASWRPKEEQVLVSLVRGSPLSAVARETGRPLIVTTRRGALHFQYVHDARYAMPAVP